MKKIAVIILISLVLPKIGNGQAIVINSYYLHTDPREEWIELLVISDNVDLRGYSIADYNLKQNGGGNWMQFKDIDFWNHMRKGTIILLYCRSTNSISVPNTIDTSKADGFLSVHAEMSMLFDNGPTSVSSSTLNLHTNSDMIRIKDALGNHVHLLGHNEDDIPANWLSFPQPKLNHKEDAYSGAMISVCPGSNISNYANAIPDTIKTKRTSANFTKGLPNYCGSSSSGAESFWRALRQPDWNNPTLSITFNPTTFSDSLIWNALNDPYPTDSVRGYLILKSSINSFSAPSDGVTYQVNDSIGAAVVVGLIKGSQNNKFVYRYTNRDCTTTLYYRVYAFQYRTDEINGNNYNSSRGRAYNEIQFAQGSINIIKTQPILYHY